MDMHPDMKSSKQDTVIKRAADRLSRPKNTDVKPVKKKNPLADLLDADDYAPPSSGYDTYDSSAVATALNGKEDSDWGVFLAAKHAELFAGSSRKHLFSRDLCNFFLFLLYKFWSENICSLI